MQDRVVGDVDHGGLEPDISRYLHSGDIYLVQDVGEQIVALHVKDSPKQCLTSMQKTGAVSHWKRFILMIKQVTRKE